MTREVICEGCEYMGEIPGDCHIECSCPGAKPLKQVWRGSGTFPYCFDACTIISCSSRKQKEAETP